MTGYAAYRTAQFLADDGLVDSDAVTHTDMDAAADHAGVERPQDADNRHAVRIALDAIGDAR